MNQKTEWTDEWVIRQSEYFLSRMFDTESRKGMKPGAEMMFIYMKTLIETKNKFNLEDK